MERQGLRAPPHCQAAVANGWPTSGRCPAARKVLNQLSISACYHGRRIFHTHHWSPHPLHRPHCVPRQMIGHSLTTPIREGSRTDVHLLLHFRDGGLPPSTVPASARRDAGSSREFEPCRKLGCHPLAESLPALFLWIRKNHLPLRATITPVAEPAL